MAFNDTKSPGQIIYSADWNSFVDFTEWISGSLYKFSTNANNIFLASTSNFSTNWTDLTDSGDTTLHIHDSRYYTETESRANFVGSSNLNRAIVDSISSNIDSRIDSLEGNDTFDHTLYPTSSNIYNKDWIDAFSGNIDTRIDSLEADTFDHTLYITSSESISRFADSSNIKYRFPASSNIYNRDWIDTLSGSLDNRIDALEGASEITWLSLSTVSSAAIAAYGWFTESGVKLSTHENDSTIHFTLESILDDFPGSANVNRALIDTISSNIVSQIGTSFDQTSYITSTNSIIRFADSSNYSSHKSDSTIHFTLESIRDDFVGSSNVNISLINSISSNLDTRIDSLYNWSSNAISLYGASSHTHSNITSWSGASGFYSISSNYYGHSSNKDIHYPSSQLRSWLNSLYQESGTASSSDVAWSGAADFYAFSSSTKQDILDLFNTSTSLSGRIDTLEALDEFDHTLYIASSTALANFNASGKIAGLTVSKMTPSVGDVLKWDNVNLYWSSQADATGGGGGGASQWAYLNPGSGISPQWDSNTYGLSSAGSDITISVAGYSFISANAAPVSSTATYRYADSSNIRFRFRPSSGVWNYVSSQLLSSNTIFAGDVHLNDLVLEGTGLESVPHTIRSWFRQLNSAGMISGGTIYSSQITKGKFNISGGYGLIRQTDNDFAPLKFFDWSVSSSIYCATGSVKYCGIKYNSGDPVAFAQDTDTWDLDTTFPLGTVVNRSGTLCILNNPWWVGDGLTNVIERFWAIGRITRDVVTGGLILGESGDGNRKVTLTAGKLWSRLNEFDIDAINTATTGTFIGMYRDGATGWKVENGKTQWPNTYYDDGDGVLGTVTVSQYANLWFYILATGKLIMVYPQQVYATAAQAEAGGPPATVPSCVTQAGILVGRIIFKGTNTTASAVQSAFSTVFTPTQATDHGNLAGLSDYDHPQYMISSVAKSRYDEYVSFSSNKSLYYPSTLGHFYTGSGTKLYSAYQSAQRVYDRFDHTLYVESSTAINKFYDSESDLTSLLNDNYAGSSNINLTILTEISSSIITHVDNNFYNKTWIDSLSGSIDSRIDILEGYDIFDHTLYSVSSNLYNRTWIDALSGSIDSRIDALEGASEITWLSLATVSAAAIAAHTSTSTGVFALAEHTHDTLALWSGAYQFYAVSSLNKTQYAEYTGFSGNLHYFYNSGDKLHSSYLSANRVLDTFDHTLYVESSTAISKFYDSESDLTALLDDNYAGSSNVNWTKIAAISSGFDGRLDDLEGNDVFDHTLYSISTNLYNRTWIDSLSGSIDIRIDSLFGLSSNLINLYYQSSLGHYYTNSGAILHSSYLSANKVLDRFDHTLYIYSSTGISKFLASSAFKRNAWDSDSWHNSSICWDKDLSAWKAKKSGSTGGASNLSELTIDVDKDWNDKSIYNATSISSNYISTNTIKNNNLYSYGEVIIGAGNDLGDYKLQVFGDSYLSGNVVFVGEISGVSDPTYASGVANKHYVDTISSNSISKYTASGKIAGLNVSIMNPVAGDVLKWDNINLYWSSQADETGGGGGGASLWAYLNAGTGITPQWDSNTYGLSGAGSDITIAVAGYSTISSNATQGMLHSSNARFYYYPSSLGKSLFDFSANKTLYPASSLVNRALIDSISSNIDTRVDSLFNWSSNALTLYGASSHTHTESLSWSGAVGYYSVSSNYYGHSSNADIHYPSSQLLSWLNALYQESGTSATSDVAWSGAYQFYSVSSLNKTQYEEYTNFSSNKSLYPASSLVNRALIDTISSNIDTRVDSLFGWSSNANNLYADSSNVRFRFPGSSSIITRYAPSRCTRYGWNSVSNEGTIAHTCLSKPTWVNLSPSGSTPIMYAFTVDDSNITVYHSNESEQCFSWRAIV